MRGMLVETEIDKLWEIKNKEHTQNKTNDW